jgi:hypothetical protein
MPEKQSQEPKAKMDLSKLAEPGKSAPRVSERTAAHTPEKKAEISFEKIGGIIRLHGPAFRGGDDATASPAESEEDEGDGE